MDDGKEAVSVQITKAIPRKMGLIGAKSGQTKNASVGSGCDSSSQRDDIHSEGLSDTNDENANELASPEIRKKSYSQMLADVSGPGNSTTPVSTTNLNNGMNMWNAFNAGAAPTPIMSASSQVSLVRTFGNEDLFNDRRPDQDESELKRLKRQQSNRESARRSKMRKQAECEELQARVEKIKDENVTLTDEIKSLAKQCEELNSENNNIMEELNQNYRCGSISALQVNNLVSRSANDEENSP